MIKEGVIKYKQEFRNKKLEEDIPELSAWRNIFYNLKLIGQNPEKYDGAGYGNLSKRIEPYNYTKNKKRFIITGTQTNKLENITNNHYTKIIEYYPEENLVKSEGLIEPSSEAMSHGIIYDLNSSTRYIFHIHSPDIWNASKKLGIPITSNNVEYGTPQMAEEIKLLFRKTNVRNIKILSMGGHEDGIITFGDNAEEAGLILLKYYSRSLLI